MCSWINENIFGKLRFIWEHSPNADFLSDVAAFEGVVIAIAIPLGYEIISRLVQRYESEVITKILLKEWIIRIFPILLTFNIVFLIILILFKDPALNSNLIWKVFLWIAFLFFLFIAFLFLWYFKRIKLYLTDNNFVLEKLYKNAEKILK